MASAEAETSRLTCRRPSPLAGPNYRKLLLDPEVEAWLRPPPMVPFKGGDPGRLLRSDRRHWRRFEFGPWALIDRASGDFVGRGGLTRATVEGRSVVELPWAILPSRQGRGLASEAAQGAIGVARELGLSEVVALAIPTNAASRRVMEKVGFSYVDEVDHVGMRHVLYRLQL